MTGAKVELNSVVEGTKAAAESGVAHAEALLAFAEALVGEDETALGAARDRLRREMSDAALVDAAGVASNFERMVRIADATGIPVDAPMAVLSADLRADLNLTRFHSAQNTPGAGTDHWSGRVLRPAIRGAIRLIGRFRSSEKRA